MIPLPDRWIYNESYPKWSGPFGWYERKTSGNVRGIITVWPCRWVPPVFGLRVLSNRITRNHEAGHAWGVRGCWKPWCLMFEAMMWKPKWKDAWWERLLAAVCCLPRWYRPCKGCSTIITTGIEGE